MGLSEINASPGLPDTQKSPEASSSKGSILHKPPPYSFVRKFPRLGSDTAQGTLKLGLVLNSEGPNLGSPLLSVGGWNVHHAGIEWMKADEKYNDGKQRTKAVLRLAFQAVHPRKVVGECQLHKRLNDGSLSSLPRQDLMLATTNRAGQGSSCIRGP